MPYVPLTLLNNGRTISECALVDSGSSVNVMPYAVGTSLGFTWEDQSTSVKRAGNLARLQAKGVVANTRVGDSEVVELVFAWTRTDHVPFLFGQVNFFIEFEDCSTRSLQLFEVKRR